MKIESSLTYLARLVGITAIAFLVPKLAVAEPADAPELPLTRPSIPADHVVNAVWSTENTFLILWLYNEPSTCPETRRTAKRVLMIVPTNPVKDGDYAYLNALELPVCIERTAEGKAASCAKGDFRIEAFGAAKEYRGDYSFVLDDGSQRKGTFRAQYCPMGN